MTKSNMLNKIVCCNLNQFFGFLKQKDPINFWTISEINPYSGQRRVRGAAVRALTETQHSSSRLQRAVLQKSAATPQPAAAAVVLRYTTKRAPRANATPSETTARTRHAKRNKSKLA